MTQAEPMTPKTGGVSLRNNPVLRREMTKRLTGFRAILLMTIPLTVLTLVLVLVYSASTASVSADVDVTELGRVGRTVFEWLLSVLLGLLLFIVPGLTSGALTGERERQTLVPLQMTMMTPMDIVVGKLSAALAFLVLLTVAISPLLAVTYLIGGVGILDIVKGLWMLIFTGVVLGSVCIVVSSKMKRTVTATVVCYGLSFAFAFGLFGVLILWLILSGINGSNSIPPPEIFAISPFGGIGDALPRNVGNFGDDIPSPLGWARMGVRELARERAEVGFGADFEDRTPIWLYYSVIGAGLLYWSLRSAAKSVTTPSETER